MKKNIEENVRNRNRKKSKTWDFILMNNSICIDLEMYKNLAISKSSWLAGSGKISIDDDITLKCYFNFNEHLVIQALFF